ncbi:protocadherin beta-15-like [Meleagris gallopavo]|uniref:protocadherin beta-15-like n=1 Tax=Meleagris gallopavo TaxID=9103 RepID=UPI0012ABB1C4|nr:protocadherin beta-15-like [Meleagris gallopavo]
MVVREGRCGRRQRALLCCVLVAVWEAAWGQLRYSVPEELPKGSFVGDVAEDLALEMAALHDRGTRILDKGRTHADPLQFFPIEVSVEDINDHSPVFPDERVTFRILETSDPGSRFPVEAAQDLDVGSNDIQAYSIVPENEFFAVSYQTHGESNNVLELVLQLPLDREEMPELDFTLVATDGGSPPRSGSTQIHIIVLDVNDNAPTFTQKLYNAKIFENAPEGSVVLRVVATDADEGINGDISYQFSQAAVQILSAFIIDPSSGEIRITKPLDYEVAQKNEFSVRAVDGGGLSALSKVLVEVVDVNDNAPDIVVSSFNSPIPENAAPGTVVALFAVRDQDSGVNGEISCALEEQLPFSLRPAFKNYYELVTVSALDREKTARYSVIVTAADAGSPRLSSSHTFTVDISDVNDNAPVFNQTSYTMYVHENNIGIVKVFPSKGSSCVAQAAESKGKNWEKEDLPTVSEDQIGDHVKNLQESLLGVVLFNIFGGDMASGIECTLSSIADDTRLSDGVDMLEGRDAIQRNLVRLKRWSHANLMKINQDKCEDLHLLQANP